MLDVVHKDLIEEALEKSPDYINENMTIGEFVNKYGAINDLCNKLGNMLKYINEVNNEY
jgi:hypothetical protein